MILNSHFCSGYKPDLVRRVFVLTLFLFSLTVGMFAQNVMTVKGVVTDSSTGEKLVGVNIQVKGSNTGTSTDLNGAYSIEARQGQNLEFSYLGYEKLSVAVQKATINVAMNQSDLMLDEVVSIGYGVMKRSDLTGAVSSIGSKEIKAGVNTSFEQAMQGRIAGVQVTQNSGTPGGGISVSIRGINSLNGNEPLYIIDGVAVSGQTGSNQSVLSTINPADITSIEVLKDASATAIYGSRASNGVVMVTTKRGEEGKPRLTYEGYFGLQQMPKKIAVMNLREYAEYNNLRSEIEGWGKRAEFADPSILGDGTDWQSELFRTAPMNNHQIGIMGGSSGVKYALSGGFLNQDGIGEGSNFKRFTFRSNVDMDVAKWLQVGIGGSIANMKQTTTLDENGLIRTAISQRPDVPAHNADGTYGETREDDSYGTFNPNPLAEALMRENYNTRLQANYNFYANLNLLKGLMFRVEYGGSINYGNSYQFTPDYSAAARVFSTSSGRKGSEKSNYWSFKSYLTYNFDLAEKNKFQIMAGHEAQESYWENLWGSRSQYISNAVHSLSAGSSSTAQNGDGSGSWGIESYYGRLNYNFDDRYLLTATLRDDGSSNFGQNYRWGTFPSAALAWRVKNESFLKNVDVLDNLKLRLGWGIVGNQSTSGYAYGTSISAIATYWGTGFYPGNYANPDLKWEETKAYNLGLDLALLKNRVELIIDAYNKNTDNLLIQGSYAGYLFDIDYTLINAPWENTGAVNNKGLEFTLNTVNINNKDFQWRTNLTLSINRNKLEKLYGNVSEQFGRIGNTVYTKSEIGQPIGVFYGYNVIGIFRNESDFYKKDANGNFLLGDDGNRIPVARPAKDGVMYPIADDQIWVGDYIFEDVDNDGQITEKDRTNIGNPAPKFTYGINNTFRWKDFELGLFFSGSYGNKVYNMMRQEYTRTEGLFGKLKEVANYARVEMIDPEGGYVISNVQVTNDPSVNRVYHTAGSMNDNNRISSRFVEDGSYLRLKNVSLSYSVPKRILKSFHIDYLQLYANIQNLFTITKYSGYDPEVGSYNVMTVGIDNARYPSQRIYTFGMRLNF